jgi:hypothetical protein
VSEEGDASVFRMEEKIIKIIYPEDGGNFSSEMSINVTRLHGFSFQKTIILKL